MGSEIKVFSASRANSKVSRMPFHPNYYPHRSGQRVLNNTTRGIPQPQHKQDMSAKNQGNQIGGNTDPL
jgi:hypothetical protein